MKKKKHIKEYAKIILDEILNWLYEFVQVSKAAIRFFIDKF